jgi:hypothetical protein
MDSCYVTLIDLRAKCNADRWCVWGTLRPSAVPRKDTGQGVTSSLIDHTRRRHGQPACRAHHVKIRRLATQWRHTFAIEARLHGTERCRQSRDGCRAIICASLGLIWCNDRLLMILTFLLSLWADVEAPSIVSPFALRSKLTADLLILLYRAMCVLL